LRNIPHCCLPQESGPCLSPSVAGRPLRPATRRRLGRPSPHQQADRPRAHPWPKNFPPPTMQQEVVSGISPGFPELSQSQGQVTHVLLTRSPLTPAPKHRDPFDLHVLSTPPAFVLSQDQTLQKRTINMHPRRGPGRSVPTEVGTIQPTKTTLASQTYRHTVEFSKNRHTDQCVAPDGTATGRSCLVVIRRDRPGLPGVPSR
jgi:hypothetical protein